MRLRWVLAVVLVLLLAGGGYYVYWYGDQRAWWAHPSVHDVPEIEPASVETVASGLSVPWDVAFLPDGSALVTERITAKLRRVMPDGKVVDVRTIAEVGAKDANQAGLQGMALSPNYEKDGWIYLFYTTDADSRVARIKLDSDAPPEPILTGIPRGNIHNGGRIRFGPDGMLYVTTGEAGERPRAQDLGNLGGKILRVTPEGKPAPGNPFGDDNPTYAMGFRDPQGIAWDESGQAYGSEFGLNNLDEFNKIDPGGNYGWPEHEGPGDDPDYIDPLATFKPKDASPSGIAVHDDKVWIACLRGQRLYRINKDGTGAEQMLTGEYGRLRLVTEAPDGSLWVLTNDRKDADGDLILRVTP